jgi:hypothetical protein
MFLVWKMVHHHRTEANGKTSTYRNAECYQTEIVLEPMEEQLISPSLITALCDAIGESRASRNAIWWFLARGLYLRILTSAVQDDRFGIALRPSTKRRHEQSICPCIRLDQ